MSQLTFEEAQVIATALIPRLAQEAAAYRDLAQLLATPQGARGFFVVFLTSTDSIADQPPTPLIQVLAQAPDPVPELLVKNLVMSTAMILHHEQTGQAAQAEGSQQVARRSQLLIQQLPACQSIIKLMYEALTAQTGPYHAFLNRWGYTLLQRQAQIQALRPLIIEGV